MSCSYLRHSVQYIMLLHDSVMISWLAKGHACRREQGWPPHNAVQSGKPGREPSCSLGVRVALVCASLTFVPGCCRDDCRNSLLRLLDQCQTIVIVGTAHHCCCTPCHDECCSCCFVLLADCETMLNQLAIMRGRSCPGSQLLASVF